MPNSTFFQRGYAVRNTGRNVLAQRIRQAILGGRRDDVGRGPLQHRHVRGLLRKLGHQRHRGCAAADDDHAFVGVVDIVAPLLRMHDASLERIDTRKFGRIPGRIVVVAAAHEHEAAAITYGFRRAAALDVDGPRRIRTRPRGTDDAVIEAHLPVDAVFGGRVADIVQNRWPIGDRLRRCPRPERIAERVHVGIRPDARVTKQIPRTTDAVARLENDIRLRGAVRLKVIAGADSGDTGADDQNVNTFFVHDQLA